MPTYEFGHYRLEVPQRRLLRDGSPVPLTPKAFDVLVALIERRERVVEKAELMQLVWGDSFVEESNLSQTIFVLRKTLGEDDNGRPFIDTIPRRGYRFAAQVNVEGAAVAPRRSAAKLVAGVAILAAIGVALGWTMLRTRHAAADPVAGKKRIVVLPFENLTRDAKDDWLAGAFSDSLTIGLQDVDDVVCISRDRIVELYRQQAIKEGAPLDAQTIKRVSQLFDVSYYVDGTYQRLGDRIRVIARLVDNDTGEVRTQETAPDDFSKLLEVEDRLASRFSAKLEARQQTAGSRPETSSLEAYRAAVEGRSAYAAGRLADAVAPLTQATALDPNYAEAWATLSKVNSRLATVVMYSSGSIEQLHRDALRDAQRAVEIAPALYDAHVALALAHRETGNLQQWRAEARKAIALNGRIAEGYELLADSYFAPNSWGCGRDRDARVAEDNFGAALRIDRRSAPVYANLSYHMSWSNRPEEAVRVADQGLAALPGNVLIIRARALALARVGRLDEAERDIQRLVAAGVPASAQDHLVLGDIALARGDASHAAREFALALSVQPTTAIELGIGRGYLDNNRLEEGLTHIDRAVQIDRSCARFVAANPVFAPYRDAAPFRARLAAWKQ